MVNLIFLYFSQVNKTTPNLSTPAPEGRKEQTVFDDNGILVFALPAVLGFFVFISTIGAILLLLMARKKRSLHGTYSPQNEEFKSPIIEMTDIVKVPDERFMERLI